MTEKTKEKVFGKPKPLGTIPIEIANLEIIIDDPLPGRGDYNQGSVLDHLILRLEAKFTGSSEVGPSCILSETDGQSLTSRARFLGYLIATKIVPGSRQKDKNDEEIKKTGKIKLWMKGLPGNMQPVSKEVPIASD